MKDKIQTAIILSLLFIVALGILDITRTIDWPEIATIENTTIQIIGSQWSGSGIIFKNGFIVTAAHVLEGIENGQASFSDGTIICLDPNTYYISQNFDLAFAKIAEYSGPYAILGVQDSIVIGADIEICGYPLGIELWHSFGRVARLENKGTIDVDVDANPGNSGGGIFLNGEVIGIITCGYSSTDISSGIAINAIQAELEIYRILYGD